MLEKENKRLKRNLSYYEKALARERGVSRCEKFESLIDGTVDCCDFSDDTNINENDGYDDTAENEDNDKDDDTDGTEKDDDEEDDEDMDKYEDYNDEPSRKRKKN